MPDVTENDGQPRAATRRSPTWDGCIAGGVTLALVLASCALLYARALRAFEDEVRQGLVRTASSAARLVDVRLHETFVSADQESTDEYERAIDPLRRLLQGSEGVAFVYTCVLRPDGVHFVLDPTPAGDADGDGTDDKSHVMDLYDDADPAMLEALRTGLPGYMAEPMSDDWGTFMSGYAPLRSDDGRLVGVVGVDMPATAYVARMHGLRAAGILGLAASLVSALGVGLGHRAHRLRAHADEDARRLLIEQMREARDRAEAATASKSDLLATLSHELRTPMNGVIGTLGLLESTPLSPAQRELGTLARSSAVSLVRLIDDILDASRLSAGRVELESIAFSPRELVGRVVRLLGTAAKRGVVLTCVVDPLVPERLTGDPTRIQQVLTNLVGNALKFTERGSVAVRLAATSLPDGRVELVLEVEDTGIGIAPARLEGLFARWAQADASTARRFGGSGLGLLITKGLVELMGGELTARSEEGKGSTFRAVIPLEASAEEPAISIG